MTYSGCGASISQARVEYLSGCFVPFINSKKALSKDGAFIELVVAISELGPPVIGGGGIGGRGIGKLFFFNRTVM